MNRCPFCNSKNIQEIISMTDSRNMRYHDNRLSNINRDFYCFNCRQAYNTNDIKNKIKSERKKEQNKIIVHIVIE